MASAFEKKISELGLTYHSDGKIGQGTLNGYNVLIKDFTSTKRYLINFPIISTKTKDGQEINQICAPLIEELRKNYKGVLLVQFTTYKLSIVVDYNTRFKINTEELEGILRASVDFFHYNELISCCDTCGEQTIGSIHELNDNPHYLCNNCSHEATQYVEGLKEEYKTSPNNYVKGALGAFLFSFIGVIAFIVVGMMGKIAAISVVIMFMAITKGYEKFGGKLNFVGAFINFIILIGMTIASNYLSVSFEIYRSMKEYGMGIFESIKTTPDLFTLYPEVKEAFNHDLTISLLFAIPISLYLFYTAYKENNPKYKHKERPYSSN